MMGVGSLEGFFARNLLPRLQEEDAVWMQERLARFYRSYRQSCTPQSHSRWPASIAGRWPASLLQCDRTVRSLLAGEPVHSKG